VPSDIPGIPEPITDLHSLRMTAQATKEAVELMAGRRGDPTQASVTQADLLQHAYVSWGDLVRMGLITKDKVPFFPPLNMK
jgi:CHAD domain-containing protein